MRAPALLLLAALLPGCFEDAWAPPDVVEDQLVPGALHVGALLPLSDGTGLSHRDALLLAAERLAAAGPLGGRAVVPIVVDGAPERSVGRAGVVEEVERRVRLMASHGVPALIVADDATALAAQGAATAEGLLIVAYAATSETVIEGPGARRPPTFRLAPPARLIGPVLAAMARESGHGTLAVVRLADDAGGAALAESLEGAFVALGGVPVEGLVLEPLRPWTLRERLGRLLAARPDVIVPALPAAHAARLVNEVAALGGGPSWLLPPAAVSEAFLESVADLGPLSGAAALAPSPGQGGSFSDFEAMFRERYGRAPGPLDSLAWDSLVLVALAAASAAAEAPQGTLPVGRDLARHLPPVTAPPGRRLGPAGLAEALAALVAGESVEYAGAYAEYDVEPSGGISGELPLQVYRIDARTGTFVPTEQQVVVAE